MSSSQRLPVVMPLAALAFAVLHLTFEYFTGGVKGHHMLNRSDLPVISNWFGLCTLPFLGFILGLRARSHKSEEQLAGIPRPLLASFLGALVYGVVLAASFELGATAITSIAFYGFFVFAFVLPVYRAEYITGFVMGMTFTFGGVLPLIVAAVVAAISFLVRFLIRAVVALVRGKGSSLEED